MVLFGAVLITTTSDGKPIKKIFVLLVVVEQQYLY